MSSVCLAPQAGKKVVVIATGGTIAGRAASAADHVGYTAGEVGVELLLAAVPDLNAWAVEAEQLAQIDSKDMDLGLWLRLHERVQHHLGRPEVTGVVVTHGTDTLEETAYFLHRTLSTDKAVVLTAAMRPASALVPDGPQNLLDAVALAGSGVLGGVVCAMAGQVWAADEVSKVHTYRTDALSAGDAGPLGWVEAGHWRAVRPVVCPVDCQPLSWPDARHWPRVELVFNHAGQDGTLVRALLAAAAADAAFRVHGLVVAGTGNGTLHHGLEDALRLAQRQGVAVRRTTRCAQGRVLGEAPDWPTSPVASPFKARIHLMLELLRTQKNPV